MSGPFIELSEPGTGKSMWVNTATLTCVAPHGRSGSYLFFIGGTNRLEAEETPGEIAARLQAAGVARQREGEER